MLTHTSLHAGVNPVYPIVEHVESTGSYYLQISFDDSSSIAIFVSSLEQLDKFSQDVQSQIQKLKGAK